MNQLPGHLIGKPPTKSVCQAAAETIEPKLGDFVAAVALQKKFIPSNKFSRNPGSLPKTYTHVLSTSGKYMAGFLLKSFG